MPSNVNATIIQSVRSQFGTRMASLRPTIPIKYPNEPITLAGVEVAQPTDAPWCVFMVHVDHSTSLTASRDAGERKMGLLAVSFFVPQNTGQLLASQLQDDYETIWRGGPIANFRFFTSVSSPVGIDPQDPSWFQANCTTPFWFDFVPS